MTIGKTIAATPDFIQQKPNTIVQGAGMLGGIAQCINQIVVERTSASDSLVDLRTGLVYGIDEEGEWYFNGSGKRPEELKKEEE